MVRSIRPLLLLALGCGNPYADESAFEAEFAARWCDRQQECALGEFEREFASFEDCADEKEDDLDIPFWEDGCEIDPDGAEECLEWIRATGCADWKHDELEDECREAYDC